MSMNPVKTIFTQRRSRVWFIVSVLLIGLVIAINVLACDTFYDLVSLVLPGKRAVYEDGITAIYPAEADSKANAKEKGNLVAKEICEEGIVLLKNDNAALPLTKGAKVSVFGKNSVNLVYGGSGSGGGNNAGAKTLFDSLSEAGFVSNPTLKAFYEDDGKSGAKRDANPSDLDSSGNVMLKSAETAQSAYTSDVISSYDSYSDAAIVVLSRIGGEGFDLPRTSSDDPNRHYLELDPNEQALLKSVTAGPFKHVILVLNSASTLELPFLKDNSLGKIDACLTLSGPGNNGAMAFGEILSGAVNPSGRTVDTFVSDMTQDPTWNNFGDCNIDKGDNYLLNGAPTGYYSVDYEEGEYVGYRYYETRGKSDGESWYQNHVVYPFGYGLSYTSFDWSLDEAALQNTTIAKGQSYPVKVTVKNSGTVAGKDVIELYASAPYTAGGIEKPAKVLCGFAKTDLLKAGESKTYTLNFDPYDIASYDFSDANKNNFAGYELEKGDYHLYLGRSAHEEEIDVPFKVADEGIRYDSDPVTGSKVENRFADADDQLSTLLSRANWDGTWPIKPTTEDRTIDNAFVEAMESRATNNPNAYSEMPSQGVDAGLTFRDLIGLAYDDPKWASFLSQLTVEEMANLANHGAFQTVDVERVGVPLTTESDGPVGFVNFMNDPSVYGTCAYPCEVMMGETWNIELLEKMGKSIGEEGAWGNVQGDGRPYSGIYAPGSNIHRSPFGGRNFEYFSEDPYLAGNLAANEIKGAREKGVAMFMKHFALNEQETHRSANGDCSWVNEQAMREIYLKPFEIAVKKGPSVGIMSSFNRIGTHWAGGDYRLLSQVLRNEWGFKGTVICDFNTNTYMSVKQMMYAGGDLNLSTTRYWTKYDAANAGDVSVLRSAAHNILYTVNHTNAMNGKIIGYKTAIWQICLFVGDGVLAVGLAVWGFFAIRYALKKEKDQEAIAA